MSEFMFGVRRGKLTKTEERKRDRVARKHGVSHIYANIPGTGYQSWFAGPNYGFPFDDALAKSVLAEL